MSTPMKPCKALIYELLFSGGGGLRAPLNGELTQNAQKNSHTKSHCGDEHKPLWSSGYPRKCRYTYINIHTVMSIFKMSQRVFMHVKVNPNS